MNTLPNDIARCDGYYAEGWREGCETCLRRTAPRPERCQMMSPPPIIAFECEFLIEPPMQAKVVIGSPTMDEVQRFYGKRRLVLNLVLTHHWFDQAVSGQKSIEYRKITEHWHRLIWSRREEITHVRFARGYTKNTATFEVEKIDTGLCSIAGWNGRYFRIHFKHNADVDASPPEKTL